MRQAWYYFISETNVKVLSLENGEWDSEYIDPSRLKMHYLIALASGVDEPVPAFMCRYHPGIDRLVKKLVSEGKLFYSRYDKTYSKMICSSAWTGRGDDSDYFYYY